MNGNRTGSRLKCGHNAGSRDGAGHVNYTEWEKSGTCEMN